MQKIITLGDFTLTSTWQVVGPTPEGYKKTNPSIGSTTLTLDLSSLPTGAIVNSATLYVEREWGDTGAALDTVNDSKWDVDYGGWTASEDISSLVRANIGGAAYLTFKFKARGHTNPPTGTKRSSLHYKITKVTIDYTPASSNGNLNKSSVQMNGTDTITLSVSSTSSTATHKTKWSVGGQGLITHNLSGLSDILIVPDSWNNYCTNGTSATARVVLETYLNGTLTGSKTYNFTVIVPSNIAPSLTPIISAIGAFEGHNLKGKTQAKITPNASGAKGSSIVSVAFSGAGQTGNTTGGTWTSNPVSSIGTHAFTVTATDSRGRTASKTVNFKVEDYSLPYIQVLACYRTDANGQPDALGTKGFLKVKYGVHIIGNNVISTVTVRLYAPDGSKLYDSPQWAKGTAEKTDSTGFGLTLDITKKYRIEFGVTDSVGLTSSLTAFIEKGASNLFDFRPDRAAIGCHVGKEKTLLIPNDWTTNLFPCDEAATKAFIVGGDANKYYPVVIGHNWNSKTIGEAVIYNIYRKFSDPAPFSWNNSHTHKGGLTLTLLWTGLNAYSGNLYTPVVLLFKEVYSKMVAGLKSNCTTGLVLFLRGGGATYKISSSHKSRMSANVYLSTYTDSGGNAYPPRTNLSQVASEIQPKF